MSSENDAEPQPAKASRDEPEAAQLEEFPLPPGISIFSSAPAPNSKASEETPIDSPVSAKCPFPSPEENKLPTYPSIPSTPPVDHHVARFHASFTSLVQNYIQDLRHSPIRRRDQLGESFTDASSSLILSYQTAVEDGGWKYVAERIVRDIGFRVSKHTSRNVDINHLLRRELVEDLEDVFMEQRRREIVEMEELGRKVKDMITEAERRYKILEILYDGEQQVFEKRHDEWVEEMERWMVEVQEEWAGLGGDM